MIEVYYKELVYVIMKAGKSKSAAQDPGELMVQMKSKASLLVFCSIEAIN